MSDHGGLPFERLELMNDPEPRGAALNMALDEVLLDRLSGDPLLRVYRWERPAVSMGCFEPAEPVMWRWPEHDLVRRWTGGGVVEHGHDLTFSLFVPRPLPLAMLRAVESYRIIHAALATAVAYAGVPKATLLPVLTASEAGSRACFEKPVPYDLMLSGRKFAGGAQRRTRRGLLHQGSVQYWQEEGWSLHGIEFFRALTGELPKAFALHVGARVVTAAEIVAARALASARYATPAWLSRF